MKYRTLRTGFRGADVRAVQEHLAGLGHEPGPVDGIFGYQTTAAVEAFQAAASIEVDGVVGPETHAALGAHKCPVRGEPPAPALQDGSLPDATIGVWIHRLDVAIERAGGTIDGLVSDLLELRVGFVLIKALDGRALMNAPLLGAAVTALHQAGIRVCLWAWVYAVYYDKDTGKPATPYHGTVEYVEEQARILAGLARKHSCTAIVCANMEGEGAWSTTSSPKAVFGPRNIRLFGGQAAADKAIAERAAAYAQTLEAELPGTLSICSTHGLSWTQRLPWGPMCTGFDVLAPQWYSPGSEGYEARVPKSAAAWRKLGARRIRGSGPGWPGRPGRWTRELRTLLRDGWAGECVDRGCDVWVYELMTDDQRHALQAA